MTSEINKVGVVGAGMMGSEIALVSAMAGCSVIVQDTDEAATASLLARIGKILDKGVERGFTQAAQRDTALANLSTTASLGDFADRDLVIEAAVEDAGVKGELFRRLDVLCRPDCIVTSNTSTISILSLSANFAPERRGRFMGTHFFSPASRMKLVEVIAQRETDEADFATVMAFCRTIGKEPIKIKDVVGFAVNRVLHALLIEAVRLVEEGVATPEDVDTACRLGLGHPIGPFQLMDLTKNSLSLKVQGILEDAYGPRFHSRPLLRQMVDAGHDGRYVGSGWYEGRAKK
jgi:3-hydroxybutyryl-CoA dehydrogenase